MAGKASVGDNLERFGVDPTQWKCPSTSVIHPTYELGLRDVEQSNIWTVESPVEWRFMMKMMSAVTIRPNIWGKVGGPVEDSLIPCREALALANDLSIAHVSVPSNCKEVVNDINNGTGGMHGNIIIEIIATISVLHLHLRR